jgi:hypothetical protein
MSKMFRAFLQLLRLQLQAKLESSEKKEFFKLKNFSLFFHAYFLCRSDAHTTSMI